MRKFLRFSGILLPGIIILSTHLHAFSQNMIAVNHGEIVKMNDTVVDGQPVTARSLVSFLDQLKTRYNVHFSYASNLVSGKFVKNPKEPGESASLNEQLDWILPPLGLRFEQMEEGLYLILQRHKPLPGKQQKTLAPDTKVEGHLFSMHIKKLKRLSENSHMSREKTVTGRVADENNEPLPGVNVIVSGTTQGTVTDVEGKYSLVVPDDNSVLIFSSVGYVQEETVVGSRTRIDMIMIPDVTSLEEIVVIGYGTESKRNLTNAVSSVKASDIEDVPAPNPALLMQGRATGVQVVQNTGTPGGAIDIRIRGNGSFGANQPLYVIDGVPMISDNTSQIYGSVGFSPLGDLNPDDIESIDILKDAAAASIYGTRAANGVVLITTKRGRNQKAQFTFNAYYGVQKLGNKIDFMNANEAWAYMLKGIDNRERETGSRITIPATMLEYNAAGVETDWQDELFQDAPMHNYEFAVRGGSEDVQYSISLNYLDQQGVHISTGFKKFSGRINLDYRVSEKLKFGSSINITRSLRDRAVDNSEEQSTIGNIMRLAAFLPVRDENGDFIPVLEGRPNPVQHAVETHFETNGLRVMANIFGEYQISRDLSIKTVFGYDANDFLDELFRPGTLAIFRGSAPFPRDVLASNTKNSIWLNENFLTYTKDLKEHRLTGVAGVSVQGNSTFFMETRGRNGSNDKITTVNNSSEPTSATSFREESGIISMFARVNYSYKDKYLLSGSVRRDGSSRFGKDNRYANFPSASVAWRISEEAFMSNIGFVDDLKIRSSYGKTGSDDIGNYTHLSIYGFGQNYGGQPGVSASNLHNPALTWQKSTQLDVGLDASILQNRVNFSVDYYKKTTTDLLFSTPVTTTSGFNSRQSNLGKIQNSGFEFSVSTRNLDKRIKWTTDFNISFNRNEVKELPDGIDIISGTGADAFFSFGGITLAREGEPLGVFYGYRFEGIYKDDDEALTHIDEFQGVPRGGDIRVSDVGGPVDPSTGIRSGPDRIINANDFVILGNPYPDFVGGMTNNISYKNFSLNFMFQFSYGNDIYNGNRHTSDRGFGAFGGATRRMNNAWGNPGDETTEMKAWWGTVFRNNQFTDYWLEDGSYLRLKVVTLSYTLPKKVLQSFKLDGVRLYATAQNLLTFTNYSGFDPEVSSRRGGNAMQFGVDLGAYPQSKVLMAGIDITF